MTVMRDEVVKALANIKVQGDEDGLIPAFGVLVNQLPVAFWNTFAERIRAAAPPEKKAEVEEGLVRCAYECGYHTGYGIINSEEFKAVVMPMVTEGAKDVLRGAFAVFSEVAPGSPVLLVSASDVLPVLCMAGFHLFCGVYLRWPT